MKSASEDVVVGPLTSMQMVDHKGTALECFRLLRDYWPSRGSGILLVGHMHREHKRYFVLDAHSDRGAFRRLVMESKENRHIALMDRTGLR